MPLRSEAGREERRKREGQDLLKGWLLIKRLAQKSTWRSNNTHVLKVDISLSDCCLSLNYPAFQPTKMTSQDFPGGLF